MIISFGNEPHEGVDDLIDSKCIVGCEIVLVELVVPLQLWN